MPDGADDTARAEQSVLSDGCETFDGSSAVRSTARLQRGEAAALVRRRSEREAATGVAIPPAEAAVGGSGVGEEVVHGGGRDNGSIDGDASTNGAGFGVNNSCVAAAAAAGEPRAPPHPQRRNNGGSRSPPAAIPPPASMGKPVLAEWMKDGSMDDSDADTANSLLGGTPSSRSSNFSSAAAAAAAAGTWTGETAVFVPTLRSVPGTQDPAAAPKGAEKVAPRTTGGDSVSAGEGAGEGMVGGGRNGNANGAVGGSARWKLAEWIKEGGVDDSDADTNASG